MKYFVSAILGIFLVLPSCKKDSINDQLGIPYVNVSRYIFLSDPNFIKNKCKI